MTLFEIFSYCVNMMLDAVLKSLQVLAAVF